MRTGLRLFGWILFISFAGALPPGTLNTTIAGMMADRSANAALLFAFGAVVVEMAIVRLMLFLIQRLLRNQKIFNSLRWISCIVLLLFATYSFHAAITLQPFRASPYLVTNAFVAGVALSLLNPLQVPFWMAWTVVLLERKILSPTARHYNIFALATGMGTALAFLLYAVSGSLLIRWLQAQQHLINWAIGLTLLITALFIAYKPIREIKPDP